MTPVYRVVAESTADEVVARAAVDGVVAGAADDDIVAVCALMTPDPVSSPARSGRLERETSPRSVRRHSRPALTNRHFAECSEKQAQVPQDLPNLAPSEASQ